MAAFTHYWSNDTYENALAHSEEGGWLNHTAGNQFSSRGVKKGD